MAFRYPIKPNGGDMHSASAYWFAVFVRFATRDSFNRSFTDPGSKTNTIENPVAELPILLVFNDIIGWTTSSSKGSHVSNAQFTLNYSGLDYAAEIAPDDWVMFFAFDNRADFERVKEKVLKNEAANGFDDGLKFVGRVDAPRRSKVRAANGGLTVGFTITANGFAEFDSTIYYNELVRKQYPNQIQFMQDFGVAIDEFVANGHTNPQRAIPALLNICLGVGPGQATKGFAQDSVSGADVPQALREAAQQINDATSPNQAYAIPKTIARLLGRPDPIFRNGFVYADILTQIIGIQEYDGRSFIPRIDSQSSNTFFTPKRLDGDALPYPIDFNNKTVWSILSTYLNEPVNEMYTSLRYGPNGVMPTFVVRQLPLSSPEFLAAGGIGTGFLDLPRWDIDDAMITAIDVGRSSAARFNYVYLAGNANLGTNEAYNRAQGLARNPPIVDATDVMRAGLRPFNATVSGTIIETTFTNENSPGRRWSSMMADILMGGHLKYTGTVRLEGIQAPICEGDNALVDGVLYHIERVQHAGQIMQNGVKVFVTNLSLTNGISIQSESLQRIVFPDMRTTDSIIGNDNFSYDIDGAISGEDFSIKKQNLNYGTFEKTLDGGIDRHANYTTEKDGE